MEQRSASSWCISVNERKFIEAALASDLRVDGRRPFDYRRITIKFGREDGCSEVQLGQTHVMGYVTSQLVQPYRDRPNEGTLSVFTEFSPMADPSFEAGPPGESAIELGRMVDRGLRESRAVDMESLCVVAGKSVWSVRVDLHIIDNGGFGCPFNISTPECSLGENGNVVVHNPEVIEPLPLIIHHLPIALTFAFFNEGNIMVIDPTHKEEFVMGGRLTATMNSNGDVCMVQKPGGEGIMSSIVMQCLRIASVKVADITSKLKNAVEAFNTQRAMRKIKRHPAVVAGQVSVPDVVMKDELVENVAGHHAEMLQHQLDRSNGRDDEMAIDARASTSKENNSLDRHTHTFAGGPSTWDPDPQRVGTSQDLYGAFMAVKEQEERCDEKAAESSLEHTTVVQSPGTNSVSCAREHINASKRLKAAVKVKGRKKRNVQALEALCNFHANNNCKHYITCKAASFHYFEQLCKWQRSLAITKPRKNHLASE